MLSINNTSHPLALLTAALLTAACATPKPPPQAPTQQPAADPAEAAAGDTTAGGPAPNVPIGELAVNAENEVRVAGVVSRVLGMRLVPPKMIFQVSDSSGTVLVVVNEKASFTEGQKIELVGHYKSIPAPMYNGPGDAPEEPVLVVDRYIAF